MRDKISSENVRTQFGECSVERATLTTTHEPLHAHNDDETNCNIGLF
jgi:hypothetical protein